ncbi:hypothetical protein Btru_056349 [Bulinus truncatus]|nr:hypothetical protein Btru_056349 [Bulinus truncatus]
MTFIESALSPTSFKRHFRDKFLALLMIAAFLVIYNIPGLRRRQNDGSWISSLQVFHHKSNISKYGFLLRPKGQVLNQTIQEQETFDANDTTAIETKFDSNHSIKLDVNHFISPFVISERKTAVELTSTGLTNGVNKYYEHRTLFVVRGNGLNNVRARTVAVIRPCDGRSGACLKVRNITFKGCRYSQCLSISNWQVADVLVIEPFYLFKNTVLPVYHRPSHQRWVMFSIEAPCRHPQTYLLNTPQFQGQFNWSMTYNLDSDIPLLYGQLKFISPTPTIDYDGVYSSKTILAAWFVSHCSTQSLRGQYVDRMQKVIQVDIFGRCGDHNCTFGSNYRYKDTTLCLPMLSSKYFFYLAFENSLCKDYVTEKLFKLFPTAKVIPVVRGGIEYKKYFPPNTYIDSADFDTPEDLAAHLKELAQDKYRYLDMLREKSKYESVQQEGWYCKLCEKMTTDLTVQWYPGNSMWSWFVQDKCKEPTFI